MGYGTVKCLEIGNEKRCCLRWCCHLIGHIYLDLLPLVMNISTSASSFPYNQKIKSLLRNGISSIPLVPQR